MKDLRKGLASWRSNGDQRACAVGHCIGIFAASWTLQLAGIYSVDGNVTRCRDDDARSCCPSPDGLLQTGARGCVLEGELANLWVCALCRRDTSSHGLGALGMIAVFQRWRWGLWPALADYVARAAHICH